MNDEGGGVEQNKILQTLTLVGEFHVKLEIRSVERGICPTAKSTMTKLFL